MSGIADVGLLFGAPIINMHSSYSSWNVIRVIKAARVEGHN
ncbi:hypothetical protein JHFBIEKO_0243 [Methylobacterium mesophilicum]|nr:hypothetical protein JHFBIEKO_0243 [Methylobacterium mesophilicum]